MSCTGSCWRVEDWVTPEGGPGIRAIVDVPFVLPSLAEAELEISETALRLRGPAGDEVVVHAPAGSAFDATNAAAKFSKKKQQLIVSSPDLGGKAKSSSAKPNDSVSPASRSVSSPTGTETGGYPAKVAASVTPAPATPSPSPAPTVDNRGPAMPDDDDDDDDIPVLDSSAPLKMVEKKKSELDQLDGEDTDGVPAEEVANEAADEMMRKMEAAREKKQQESEKSRKEAQKSTGGLKKGFFGNDKKKEPKKKSSDNDKQIVKKSETTKPPEEEIPFITGSGADWKQSKLDSLKLPEVQAALKQQTEKMKTDQSWCTPQLMQALASRPDLMKGLSNPRVMEAFELMQKDAAAAKKKYENDKEVTDFLMEFSKLMATHFEVLGKEEETSKPQATYQTPQGQTVQGQPQILQNPEVEKTLKDPEVQQIIAEMQRGRPLEMRELASQNPRLFMKLKILLDAGLFNLQGT